MRAQILAWNVLFAMCVGACGAGEREASPVPEASQCPRLSDYLTELDALLETGELAHVRNVIADDLDEADRSTLVLSLIRILESLEPGTFVSLDATVSRSDLGTLENTLSKALRWLAVDGPEAPYSAAIEVSRGLINRCDGAAVFGLAVELLSDPEFIDAIDALLSGADSATLGKQFAGFSLEELVGEPAVLALIDNILRAAMSEHFELDAVLQLADLLVALERAPWPSLVSALERVFSSESTLSALRALVGCLQEVDDEQSLVRTLLALVTDSDLSLLGPLEGPVVDERRSNSLIAVMEPLLSVLELLAGAPDIRRDLQMLMNALLRPSRANGVMQDLLALLEAGVLGDLVRMFTSLATPGCAGAP